MKNILLHRRTKFTAIFQILFGSLVLSICLLLYFLYRRTISDLGAGPLDAEQAQLLTLALKRAAFGVCPGLCLVSIGTGIVVLVLLKKMAPDEELSQLDAPSFNQQGGKIVPGFNLTLSARRGTVYYTTNGVDPRVYETDAVSPEAVAYAGAPIPITTNITIKTRALSGRTWSALNESLFTTDQ